jgi:predicted ATP-dependent serine protease
VCPLETTSPGLFRAKRWLSSNGGSMAFHDNGRATEHIAKSPTGIEGFDTITGGGLPHRRTTLLIGAPGDAAMRDRAAGG